VKWLPCIARVHVTSPDSAWPTVWLPLFLLWPLVLLALPLAWLGLFVWASRGHAAELPRVGPFIAGCLVCLCELRGTRLDVSGPQSRVFIAIS
jgi:hypothetical protein